MPVEPEEPLLELAAVDELVPEVDDAELLEVVAPLDVELLDAEPLEPEALLELVLSRLKLGPVVPLAPEVASPPVEPPAGALAFPQAQSAASARARAIGVRMARI